MIGPPPYIPGPRPLPTLTDEEFRFGVELVTKAYLTAWNAYLENVRLYLYLTLKGGPGSRPADGNRNAWKHGKYSRDRGERELPALGPTRVGPSLENAVSEFGKFVMGNVRDVLEGSPKSNDEAAKQGHKRLRNMVDWVGTEFRKLPQAEQEKRQREAMKYFISLVRRDGEARRPEWATKKVFLELDWLTGGERSMTVEQMFDESAERVRRFIEKAPDRKEAMKLFSQLNDFDELMREK